MSTPVNKIYGIISMFCKPFIHLTIAIIATNYGNNVYISEKKN